MPDPTTRNPELEPPLPPIELAEVEPTLDSAPTPPEPDAETLVATPDGLGSDIVPPIPDSTEPDLAEVVEPEEQGEPTEENPFLRDRIREYPVFDNCQNESERQEIVKEIDEFIAKNVRVESAHAGSPPERLADGETRFETIKLALRELFYIGRLTTELFNVIAPNGVLVKREDSVASNGNKYLGGADTEHGRVNLYPEFFSANPDTGTFDQEHAIAHEFGELLFHELSPEDRTSYGKYRLPSDVSPDGDYASGYTDPKDRYREEFAETTGDYFQSNDKFDMIRRRMLRIQDPAERQRLQDSFGQVGPNGDFEPNEFGYQRVQDLTTESAAFEMFLKAKTHEVRNRGRKDDLENPEGMFDEFDNMEMPMFDTESAPRMAPKPPKKEIDPKKDFFGYMFGIDWQYWFGKPKQ